MLKVNYTVYDGCNWSSYTETQIFKDEKDLDDFINRCWSFMDEVHVNHIEVIKDEEAKQ